MGKLTVSIILLMVVGCSHGVAIPSERLPLNLPEPEPMEFRDVRFNVLEGNFCLEPEQYKNLATNMQEIYRFTSESVTILDEYRSYYEPGVK